MPQSCSSSSHLLCSGISNCQYTDTTSFRGVAASSYHMLVIPLQQYDAFVSAGLKFWRPTSPGTRGRVTINRIGIWKGRPMRCLSKGATRIGGRNCYGRITVRHRCVVPAGIARAYDTRPQPLNTGMSARLCRQAGESHASGRRAAGNDVDSVAVVRDHARGMDVMI